MAVANEDALIFVSWSGEASKQVSESDGDKGARWRIEIEKRLEDAIAGVIVVTKDNQDAPWLLFESGALSKKTDRVYTFLFDLPKGHLRDPLAQFNATSHNRDETLKMLKSINERLGSQAVEEGRMVKAFDHRTGPSLILS